jgi:transcriptional regulator with XRE-family HTH domain
LSGRVRGVPAVDCISREARPVKGIDYDSVRMDANRAVDSAPPADADVHVELGRWLRLLRKRKGLSLAAVAEQSGLSQSFLSQMERGLTQPSLRSVNRVARALGTTTPAVFALQGSAPVSVVRHGEGEIFAEARLLVRGNRAIHPLEIRGAPTEFGDYFEHPGEELLYVIAGQVEAEVARTTRYVLEAGDAIYYAGLVGHRWRNMGGGPIHVLMVTENRPSHG